MFFWGKCSCVAPWSRVTVLRGCLTVGGLLSPAWVPWSHLVPPALLATAQLILPGADIPIMATAPLGVAFRGGAARTWCEPCPVPSQLAKQELGGTAVGRGVWEGAGRGTAVDRVAQEPFIPLKLLPCLSTDPESQRKRTVQNVLDLRQNLEETMSSLRGSQVSHR